MENHEIHELKEKLEELNQMYTTLQKESQNTTKLFERRLEEQEQAYQEILKNMKSPKIQASDGGGDDNESNALEYSFLSSLPSPEGPNPTSDYKNFTSKERVQVQTAETQTALAIDPQTSVKLSFISAGLSTYGNTIEDTFYSKIDQRSTRRFYDTIGSGRNATFSTNQENYEPRHSKEIPISSKKPIPATPPRNNVSQPTPPRHVHYSSPNRSQRYNQHIDSANNSDSDVEEVDIPSRPKIDLNQSTSKMSTPTIPPKTPLKGILRTPIRAPATPLPDSNAFNRNHVIQMLSPAMSPIHAVHGENDAHYDPHTTGMFDASDSDLSIHPRKGEGDVSPPLIHQQPDEIQSSHLNTSQRSSHSHSISLAELQRLSYLDLSTGSHQMPVASHQNDSVLTTSTGLDTLHSISLLDITSNTSYSQPKQKKKSSRRRKTSSDRMRNSDSFLSSQRIPASSEPFSTSMRHSYSYSSTPSHRHPLPHASQMTSKFWRSRLGQRDMTSILSSPKSFSVFS